MKTILLLSFCAVLICVLSFSTHYASASPTIYTISNKTTCENNGLFNGVWYNSTCTVNSDIPVLPLDTLKINNGITLNMTNRLSNIGTIDNHGTINAMGSLIGTASFLNSASGIINLKSHSFMDCYSRNSKNSGVINIGDSNSVSTIIDYCNLSNLGTINIIANLGVSKPNSLVIAEFSSFDNMGTIVNQGLMLDYGLSQNNGGIIENNNGNFTLVLDTAFFENNGGTFELKNNAVALIYHSTFKNNSGKVVNDGGTFTSNSALVLNNHGEFINNSVVTNNHGNFINNSGIVANIHGNFTNNSGVVANNHGNFTNNYVVTNNHGNFTNNSGTLDNYGIFKNNSGRLENNFGLITNHDGGIITNHPNAIVSNTLGSTINNSNKIINSCGGIIWNHGTISGNLIINKCTISTVDPSIHGIDSSITIGTDNLPVISYEKYVNGTSSLLRVAHCGNPSCSAGNTITTLAGSIGLFTSPTAIAIGSDGMPIVGYQSNNNLEVVHCGNITCSGGNSGAALDSQVAQDSISLAIGTDGLPVLSYQLPNSTLKTVHCGNVACSSGNIISMIDSSIYVPFSTSIVVGKDGLPLISYLGSTGLKVAHCGNFFCSTGNNLSTVDPNNGAGTDSSMKIGTDGLPIISYHTTNPNKDLNIAHCGNVLCSAGNTISIINSVGIGGEPTSISIDSDGLPIIIHSLVNPTNAVGIIKCGNVTCSGNGIIATIGPIGHLSTNTSVAIGADGLPIIVYQDLDLKVLECGSITCK